MRIGLFIPCFLDAFFPEVGIATLELLERFGNEVVYPRDQTCCGQPMANSGFNADCANTEALFVRNFFFTQTGTPAGCVRYGFDYVVAPSGSCVEHVRANFDAVEQTPQVKDVRGRTYELVEFLHDIQKAEAFPLGTISASGRAAQQLRDPAAPKARHTLRAARANLFQTNGPVVQGRGHSIRQSGAPRRVLRLRRHLLGIRGSRLDEDGL